MKHITCVSVVFGAHSYMFGAETVRGGLGGRGVREWARLPKFLRVRSGFKFCGSGQKIQPAHDSSG